MVQDLRRIMLSTDELLQALSAYRNVSENFLPAGPVVGFDIAGADSIDVIIASEGLGSQQKRVNVQDNLLVHVLIRFCIENNIMLPRQGRKSALVAQGGVALCIALDVETYLLGDMDALALATYTLS